MIINRDNTIPKAVSIMNYKKKCKRHHRSSIHEYCITLHLLLSVAKGSFIQQTEHLYDTKASKHIFEIILTSSGSIVMNHLFTIQEWQWKH